VHLDLLDHAAPANPERTRRILSRGIVAAEAPKEPAVAVLAGTATGESRGALHEEGKQLAELALPGGQDSEDTHFERF
jgi:hypothetical protein